MIQCRDGSIYTGITNDLERRFREHKEKKGGHYTSSHGVEKIIYAEEVPTKSAALKREAQIKALKRGQKIKMINAKNTSIDNL